MIHPHTSLSEITAILRIEKVLPIGIDVHDREFAEYVLESLTSIYGIRSFFVDLDIASEDKFGLGTCPKADAARQYLDGANATYWQESIDRMRIAVAQARHTSCSCHEDESFALA